MTYNDGPWLAHDHPERPFDEWTWLCSCDRCEIALEAVAHRAPHLPIVLKGHTGRKRFAASELLSAIRGALPYSWGWDDLEREVGGIREVFVAAGHREAVAA